MSEYQVNCKGSLILGTGCDHCRKCQEERIADPMLDYHYNQRINKMSDTKSNDMQRVQERRLQDKKVKQDFLLEIGSRLDHLIETRGEDIIEESKNWAYQHLIGPDDARENAKQRALSCDEQSKAITIIQKHIIHLINLIKKEVANA